MFGDPEKDGKALRESDPSTDRFQFGIWQMLLLITVTAVVLAAVSWIGGPAEFRLVFGLYLAALAGYFVLRGPGIAHDLASYLRQVRTIRGQRQRIARECADFKRRLDETRHNREASGTDGP